jgi:hypothetical protein
MAWVPFWLNGWDGGPPPDIVESGTCVVVASFSGAEAIAEMVTLQAPVLPTAQETLAEEGQESVQATQEDQEAVTDAATAPAGLSVEDLEALAQAAEELVQAQPSGEETLTDEGTVVVTAEITGEAPGAPPEEPPPTSVARLLVLPPLEEPEASGTVVLRVVITGEHRTTGIPRRRLEDEELLVLELV